MPRQYEPEFALVFQALQAHMPKREKLQLETIPAIREVREAGYKAAFDQIPESPDVKEGWHYATSRDGASVAIHSFMKNEAAAEATSAIVHFHGGGLVLGSSKAFARSLAAMVSQTSVPIFSVNYRLAPEHKGKTLVEDCYAGVQWLYDHAEGLGIDKSRIGVFGESAGGGLAAGVALLARDRKLEPPLAKQILVYPMLDDRTVTPNPTVEPLAFWKTEDNVTGWTAVLGTNHEEVQPEDLSYVVPARARDLSGLPPAYIDVGTLDIFLNEDIEYAKRLLDSDVEVELHVYPGVPHAFELVQNISATKRATDNRVRAMQSI